MPSELVDRGRYSSLEVFGIEYVDREFELWDREHQLDGMILGVVVENTSDEVQRFWSRNLEVIDSNGFSYAPSDDKSFSILSENIPSGWYIELSNVKPNRKYRYLGYIRGFHGEIGRISYTDRDGSKEFAENLDIDLTNVSTDEIGGLPIVDDAIEETLQQDY